MSYLTEAITHISSLAALNLQEVDKPVLSYDSLKKQVIYTFIGRNAELSEYIIELRITATDFYRLEKIFIYTPQAIESLPTFLAPFTITTIAGQEFSIPVITKKQDVKTDLVTNEDVNIQENNSSINNNFDYINMLSTLKNAKEKGCF